MVNRVDPAAAALMRALGHTFEEIGERFGVSKQAVHQALRGQNLLLRKAYREAKSVRVARRCVRKVFLCQACGSIQRQEIDQDRKYCDRGCFIADRRATIGHGQVLQFGAKIVAMREGGMKWRVIAEELGLSYPSHPMILASRYKRRMAHIAATQAAKEEVS